MTKYKTAIKSLIILLLGTALSSAAFGMLILPLGFAAGGVTGFSKSIAALLGLKLSAVVLGVNAFLLVSGFVFLGREFAAKTVSVSLLFPLMLEFFSRFPLTLLKASPAAAVLSASLMFGLGTGLILKSGASSGGFDTLAVIVNRRFHIPVTLQLNLIDGLIILTQAIGKPIENTLCGIAVISIGCFIAGKVMSFKGTPLLLRRLRRLSLLPLGLIK